jgi:hypothetical protein
MHEKNDKNDKVQFLKKKKKVHLTISVEKVLFTLKKDKHMSFFCWR